MRTCGDLARQGTSQVSRASLSGQLAGAWQMCSRTQTWLCVDEISPLASLLDKHVALPMRLRLFEAAIAPTLTYSLKTVALTQKLKDRVDVVQRRMLRRIVG